MKRIFKSTFVLLSVFTGSIVHAQDKNMKTVEENYHQWYPGYTSSLETTDPELTIIFKNFAFGETQEYGSLDIKTRTIVTMAYGKP